MEKLTSEETAVREKVKIFGKRAGQSPVSNEASLTIATSARITE
jgi:hypothetical protein